ncbi:hypothetical protein CFT12S00416_07790 [Campylobacter fetus subsp. testudinum]|uniref:hypothetical protein n=1 Tax=Campylobacter fetus TaxID=196 RepID=UPI0008189862|nr:hypothetical protein [Campylobacter fetus]OCR87720.1 hypothetical protein CFT12S00416_07790 [Campylobacter fetus subsp. testudinum]OCR98875.1 hypothetical protein A9K75_09505 [Campylobacter fetus subsp. testudinum]
MNKIADYLKNIRDMQDNDYEAFVAAYLYNEFSYTINENVRTNPNESDIDFLKFSYTKFMNTEINLYEITDETIEEWKNDYKANQELETSMDNFKRLRDQQERELITDIIEHLNGNENGELGYISKDLNYVRNELSSRDLEEIFSNNEEICMEIAGQRFNPKNIKQSIQDVAELAVFLIAKEVENDYVLKLLFNEYYKDMLDRQEDIQNLVCEKLGNIHIPIGNFECYDEHSMIMDGIENMEDIKDISKIFSDIGYKTSILSDSKKSVIVLADENHEESFQKAIDYLVEAEYRNIYNMTSNSEVSALDDIKAAMKQDKLYAKLSTRR